MPRLSPRSVVSVGSLGLAVAFLLSAGCGPKQRPYAPVKGKVMYQGKPVSAGNVYFVLSEDPNFTGGDMINADGEFSGTAPIGKVKLAIQTASFKPGAIGGPPGGGTSRPPGSGGPGGSSRPPGSGGPGSSGPPPGGGGPGGPGGGPSGIPGGMDYIARTGQGGEGDAKAKLGKYTPIPEKYETIETTDLEFEIKPGDNDLGTIELKGALKK